MPKCRGAVLMEHLPGVVCSTIAVWSGQGKVYHFAVATPVSVNKKNTIRNWMFCAMANSLNTIIS